MKDIKEIIGWAIGIFQIIVGLSWYSAAKMEMSSHWLYSWSPPYTSYEVEVITKKWIGILLIISGIIWLSCKIYQKRYTEKHVKEIDQIMKKGSIIKCQHCGLALSSGVEKCPRCGVILKFDTSDIGASDEDTARFCSRCGNKISTDELFCSKCGQKISK